MKVKTKRRPVTVNSVFHRADCLEWMRTYRKLIADQGAQPFNLVFGSPPYEDARTYDMGFKLKGEEWVSWMVKIVRASLAVCDGLVAFVMRGRTRKFRYSCTPELLIADLPRAGVHVRESPLYERVGIPGSGGPDWLANRYEKIVCCTNGGRLPWSDNVAMGHPPKRPPGGNPSHRTRDGGRANSGGNNRKSDGSRDSKRYVPPKKANPGNIIRGTVGGGAMGDIIAHENEAPFPEWLAEFFIRSFCRPGGWVLDPFSGSGTTVAVARKWGRNGVGLDIRKTQIELGERRCQ